MPDLLLELFSEEIPARMQAKAAEDLRKGVTDRLVEAGLVYEGAKAFVTPRRLALWVQGLPVRQPDVKEEKKGPRVGAPEKAIEGFLKSAGLTSIDQAVVQQDKKGDFYIARIDKPGRDAIQVIAEIVPEVIRTFPWPKQMRWGEASAHAGALTWVRPLHSIVATFGPETEEPEIVRFSIGGIEAGDTTRGHRFLAPGEFKVKRLDDYAAKLEAAKVVLDPARRQEIILADAKNLAFAQGYELIEDAGLLAEAAGLVEWPVVLMGSFDEAFLNIPPEVIRTTIRNNQKCFVLSKAGASPFETRPMAAPQGEGRSSAAISSPHPEEARSAVSKDGRTLANRFILIANTEATDGGEKIIAGNERVIRARLSDAKFFYETDLKTKLEDRLEKLKDIVFHEKLGTQYERVERIERLAREIAPMVGADPDKAARAARLAKADLVTEMVGEFPELQGLMGKYYALAQGEDASVAAACEEHWKPQGPSDRVPRDPISIAVALAEKIDTLVGFWAIDQKPSGSKDPYQLRRAALGVVRVILENELRIPLVDLFLAADIEIFLDIKGAKLKSQKAKITKLKDEGGLSKEGARRVWNKLVDAAYSGPNVDKESEQAGSRIFDLLDYHVDRIETQLHGSGFGHNLVRAALGIQLEDDLLLITRRVDALAKFLATDDGKNLLAGAKRAANIIAIEEKKDARNYNGKPDPSLYNSKEERELAVTINLVRKEAEEAVAREDFEQAMHAISRLRPFVDAFFENVTVNTDMADIRDNRLKLLNEIREATRTVADFSKIAG